MASSLSPQTKTRTNSPSIGAGAAILARTGTSCNGFRPGLLLRDVISKDYSEALELFEQVPDCIKIPPNTYDALINACIALRSRQYAKLLVARYLSEYVSDSDSDADSDFNISADSDFDIYLYNRFIFLFIKCGLIHRAHRLFDKMPKRNATSFNMILYGSVFFGKYLEIGRAHV